MPTTCQGWHANCQHFPFWKPHLTQTTELCSHKPSCQHEPQKCDAHRSRLRDALSCVYKHTLLCENFHLGRGMKPCHILNRTNHVQFQSCNAACSWMCVLGAWRACIGLHIFGWHVGGGRQNPQPPAHWRWEADAMAQEQRGERSCREMFHDQHRDECSTSHLACPLLVPQS